MALKALAKQLLWRSAQLAPGLVIAGYETVGNIRYGLFKTGRAWKRKHPYDRIYRVHTSGMVPGYMLKPGDPLEASTTLYGPVQPSVFRAALRYLPERQIEDLDFLDIGCGKGRALLLASEFKFHSITGIELSPTLASIARRNAKIIARAYPNERGIGVVTGDALAYQLPVEHAIVVFLYNPFDATLMARLLKNIEASLREVPRDLYVVYYNPVSAAVFDDSPALERRFAMQIPIDPSEIGFGPNAMETVIIWQNRGNTHPRPAVVAGGPAVLLTANDQRSQVAVQL